MFTCTHVFLSSHLFPWLQCKQCSRHRLNQIWRKKQDLQLTGCRHGNTTSFVQCDAWSMMGTVVHAKTEQVSLASITWSFSDLSSLMLHLIKLICDKYDKYLYNVKLQWFVDSSPDTEILLLVLFLTMNRIFSFFSDSFWSKQSNKNVNLQMNKTDCKLKESWIQIWVILKLNNEQKSLKG